MGALPWLARGYIALVVAAAVAVVAYMPTRGMPWLIVGVLAVLAFTLESAATLLHRGGVRMSVSFAAPLAAIVLAGPGGAALVNVAIACIYARDYRMTWYKRLFNGGLMVLTGYAAGLAYIAIGGVNTPLSADDFPWILLPYVVAVVTYCTVNGLLLIGVLWLAGGTPPQRVWPMLAQTIPSYLGFGFFGLVIAALWASLGPVAAVLVLFPLFVARWALSQHAKQQEAYDATIATLCQAVETKDYYTRGHCERVSRAAVLIGGQLGMRVGRISGLRYAGMLHDVGKLGVPTDVLQKPGSLTDDEFDAIRLHPTRGVDMVRDIEFLDEARAGIVHHHERMDGRGYPSGLEGKAIPEFARAISVADAFDCMTSTRSYRSARSVSAAIDELRRHAGAQFDPVMVEALVRAVDRHGWQPHEPEEPASDELVTVAGRDHDDPSAPLTTGQAGQLT